MIEVLESLKYKTNQDLTVSETANNVVLPTYTQSIVNGRYQFTKSFSQDYIKGAVNYLVTNQDVALVRAYIDLKSSYDPLDYQIDYLSTTIYDKLPTLDIAWFIWWYDQVNTYGNNTLKKDLSSKALYGQFSDSVGEIALFTPTTESTTPITLNSADIKSYNRSVESSILDDIRATLDQSYKDVNSSYAANTVNVAGGVAPSTAHGSRLVVDAPSNTRYASATATYLTNLINQYKQLLYLSPIYAVESQAVVFSAAPYFSTTIEGTSVVVDKLGNKVNTNQGWTEQIMLSSYTEE